jgi:peptidyl-prolyl cis-trans isomerase SurA
MYRMYRRFTAFITLGSALLVVAAGCHRSPNADVVAVVNGKQIMRADLDRQYEAQYQARAGDAAQKPTSEVADTQRLSILHEMISDEVLQQQAVKLNLAASDEDVNAKLIELKAPFTPEEFDAQLKQRNLTLDDYKRAIRRDLTLQKLLNKEIESKINITDAEISAYYTLHKAEFNNIEPRYHLAQIATSGAPSQQAGNLQNNKASSDADAKKKIEMLHNRLESGDDFATVAMNFSEDPNTSSSGGDMGFLPESALKSDPAVFDAIGKLKPGQYTDVMPVFDGSHRVAGYAIYRLISRDPAGQHELSDPRVKQAIHNALHSTRAQLLKNAYLEVIQNEAKVTNYFAEQVLKQDAQ